MNASTTTPARPIPTVKPAPSGSPEVHEGRAPALCAGCGGHHGPVNAYILCLLSRLATTRAEVVRLREELAQTSADAARGRAARENLERGKVSVPRFDDALTARSAR